MGRQINFNFRRGGGSPVEVLYGTIKVQPTRAYKLGPSIVLPRPRTIPLVNGVATLPDAAITPPGPLPAWLLQVTVSDLEGNSNTWYVAVPEGEGAINFNRLPTFEVAPPETEDLTSIASDAMAAKVASEAAQVAAQNAAALVGAPAGAAIEAAILGQGPARDSVYSVVEGSANPALGNLYAGYARAMTETFPVLFCGSSTTEGSDQRPNDRWVNKVVRAMQAQYSAGPGSNSPIGTAATAIIGSPGVHGYNFGLSGTHTGNYMPAEKITQAGLIEPGLIVHMVGSNDANLGYSAETFRANLIGVLDQLDSAMSGSHSHVLVHAHQRQNKDISALWNAYRKVLRDLADTRTNVAFVDLSYDFEAVGIPGTDPLDLLKPDEVHLTVNGHDMCARLMAKALGVTLETPRPKSVVADTFTRANGPTGISETGQPWTPVSGSFQISSNQMALVSAGTNLIEAGTADFDLSADIYHPGDESFLAGLVFWAKDNDNRMGIFIDAGSSQRVTVYSTIGGSNTLNLEAPVALSSGWHNLRVVARSGNLYIYLDNNFLQEYTPSATYYDALGQNTKVGVRCGATVTSMRWDNFYCRTR